MAQVRREKVGLGHREAAEVAVGASSTGEYGDMQRAALRRSQPFHLNPSDHHALSGTNASNKRARTHGSGTASGSSASDFYRQLNSRRRMHAASEVRRATSISSMWSGGGGGRGGAGAALAERARWDYATADAGEGASESVVAHAVRAAAHAASSSTSTSTAYR